jgi:hypothetical protein
MRESVTTRIVPESEPNPYVTVGADALGIAGAVLENEKLGVVGSIMSVANDPRPQNLVISGLGLVPGLDVPIAFGSVAWDGSKFVADQIIIPVFTPDASQAEKIDDGYGHLIPNPAMTEDDVCQAYSACN